MIRQYNVRLHKLSTQPTRLDGRCLELPVVGEHFKLLGPSPYLPDHDHLVKTDIVTAVGDRHGTSLTFKTAGGHSYRLEFK